MIIINIIVMIVINISIHFQPVLVVHLAGNIGPASLRLCVAQGFSEQRFPFATHRGSFSRIDIQTCKARA